MSSFPRLINATGSDIMKMTPMDLKEAILKSEGRTICGQHLLFAGPGLVRGVTNSELMFAFGADMVLLNTINLDDPSNNPGLCGMTYRELKELCRRPIGVYLGCPGEGTHDAKIYSLDGMPATSEHVAQCVEMGVDFIVLEGNPGSGTRIKNVIETTKRIKDEFGDKVFVWAGKWEDGITEPVLGDPVATAQGRDDREIVRQLIDAGADCIDLPAPGTRSSITVESIRDLVTFTQTYKPGTLAMSCLNSSVEGADTRTVCEVTLLMKQAAPTSSASAMAALAAAASPRTCIR